MVTTDYFAAGHSVEDLLALATTDLRNAPSEERPLSPPVSRLTPLQVAELRARAAPVLAVADPLVLFRESLVRCGYGGNTHPAVVTYLAATTRVLAIRQGAMPAHLLLLGPPSTGKNWTINLTLRHLPPNAYVLFDAGSPRVLIYDAADLRHRVVVFGEADSLPSGEDNPAASAVRNLLQDHHLHYKVTVRDPATGQFAVRTIDKPGPSVLFTTAVRRLGPQLESRLFALEIPDDPQQVQAALRTQADLELAGAADPPPALVAFQEYLQALAPWEVLIPFVGTLAEMIGRSATAPRILRDFARLISLIKATSVLHHTRRQRDAEGRLVATIEDYAIVHGLVADLYTASTTGAGRKARETVTAVAALKAEGTDPVTVTAVAGYLKISKQAASGRVGTALQGGWLINREERSGRPYRLDVGEPLPPETGLPSPFEVGCQGVNLSTGGKKDDFSDAFTRYLPSIPAERADEPTTQAGLEFQPSARSPAEETSRRLEAASGLDCRLVGSFPEQDEGGGGNGPSDPVPEVIHGAPREVWAGLPRPMQTAADLFGATIVAVDGAPIRESARAPEPLPDDGRRVPDGEPLCTPEDLARGAGRGQLVLRVGEARAWPPYPYAPGRAIASGRTAWIVFVRHAPDREFDLAVQAMITDPALNGPGDA